MKKQIFLLFRFGAMAAKKVSNIFWGIAQRLKPEDYQQSTVIGSTAYSMVNSPDEPYYAQQYWTIISQYLTSMPEDARALDLGCSQGRLSKKLGERFCKGTVSGCDISSSAIQEAEHYAVTHSLDNIEFHVQSISECLADVKKESCDVILHTEVAFFYPDWKSDLPNIIESLKPGGILAISLRSQYFNALCLARDHRWESVDKVVNCREGEIVDPGTTFTWQTSSEIESLFIKEDKVELLEIRGIGVCSGISADPHDFICQPSQLNDKNRQKLMQLELEVGKSAPDSGRYILAIVRKL
jgi:SAM-dependent methyltransferase